MQIIIKGVEPKKAKELLGVTRATKVTQTPRVTLTDPVDLGTMVRFRVAAEIGVNPDGSKHSARGYVTLPKTELIEKYLVDMLMVVDEGKKRGWYPLEAEKAAILAGDSEEIEVNGVKRMRTPIEKVIFGELVAAVPSVRSADVVEASL